MAISYPIALPASPTSRAITWRKRSAVASAVSPFTYQAQSYAWAGQAWAADVVLPPMTRANAETWIAALSSLNGAEGSFLLGDRANLLPRGVGLSAAVISTSPAINNGGFETAGGGGADVFANWTEFIGGTCTLTRDTTIFFSGGASLKAVMDNAGSVVAVQQFGVLSAGKRYRMTFYAKATGTGSVRVSTAGGATVYYSTGTLTSSWVSQTVDFTAVDGTIELDAIGNLATIWIDACLIQPLDTYGGLVNGASQTGYDLVTDGWQASQTGIMLAGDWLQLGTGNTSRLYKVMADANSDASGNATLTLWPKLRSSPADNDAITVSSPKGRFMLAQDIDWSIDEAHIYGLNFSAVEDMRP